MPTLPPSRPSIGRPLILGLLLGTLLFWNTGCELKLPPMPWDPPPAASSEEETSAHESESDAEEIEPVDMRKLLPPAMRDLAYEEITIPMADKLQLYGRLYDPSIHTDEDGEVIVPAAEEDEDYAGPRYPLVILVHGLNHTHSTWQDLPATLVKAGYAVFALDLRGHGKSTRKGQGSRVSWRMMNQSEWLTLPQDVEQVVKYFAKGEDYPQVDARQVSLIGEKLGANVVTPVAKKQQAQVKAIVLISPGLVYKGIDASRSLLDYNNQALILTSRSERESFTMARHLYNWLTGPKAIYEYDEKTGQGSDMLLKAAIGNQIRDWLLKAMPSPHAPPASEPPIEESPPNKG